MDEDGPGDGSSTHSWARIVFAVLVGMTAIVLVYGAADWVFEYTGGLDRSGLSVLTGARTLPGLVVAQALSAVASTVGLTVATTTTAAWLWLRRRSRFDAVFLVVAMILSSLTTLAVKHLVDRPRPSVALQVGREAVDPAFPSGHTLNGTVFLVLLLALVRPFGGDRLRRRTVDRVAAVAAVVVGVVLLAGVGISRVYLGYHWPTDVVAGWLVGAVLATGLVAAHRSLARPPAERWSGRRAQENGSRPAATPAGR